MFCCKKNCIKFCSYLTDVPVWHDWVETIFFIIICRSFSCFCSNHHHESESVIIIFQPSNYAEFSSQLIRERSVLEQLPDSAVLLPDSGAGEMISVDVSGATFSRMTDFRRWDKDSALEAREATQIALKAMSVCNDELKYLKASAVSVRALIERGVTMRAAVSDNTKCPLTVPWYSNILSQVPPTSITWYF